MNTTLNLSPLVIGVLLAWTTIFVLSLGDALTRTEFDSITRLTWVIVIVFVPFFGLLLYGLYVPRRNPQSPSTSESEVAGTPWAHDPGHTSRGAKN